MNKFMNAILAMLAVSLTACATVPTTQPTGKNTQTRKAFATAFAQLKEGMPANEAAALLGKPDDIRTQSDPGAISLVRAREIWGYGVDHHLGIATLGTVMIDENNQVQYFNGTSGADELVARLGEPELRRLLRIVARACFDQMGRSGFSSRDTIAAVNALQPLGKTAGVGVMKEYIQISSNFDNDEGLIMVMRALFEVPPAIAGAAQMRTTSSELDRFIVVHPGFFRPPMLGAPHWFPDDLTKFPLFPLVIIDDIPLDVVGGYTLGGVAESAAMHLKYLENSAQWRSRPLRPSDDPLGAYSKVMAMIPPGGRDELTMIESELLQLIDTVYRPTFKDDDEDYPSPEKIMAWFTEARQQVQELKMRWDSQLNCYVRGDGSILPAISNPLYHRTVFNPRFADDSVYRLEVVLERENSRRIGVNITLDVHHGAAPAFKVRVIHPGNPEEILVDNVVNAKDSPNVSADQSKWSSLSYSPALAVGQSVRVEIVEGDHHFVSPPVIP